LTEVPIAPASPERFRPLLGDGYGEVEAAVGRVRSVLEDRVIWHVNSTARGGGVAEMLQSLLAYARGAGANVRWLTIEGDAEFFRLTKRIHNRLHGAAGDGGALGDEERRLYERTLAANAEQLRSLVGGGDVIYLHDPQTAGLTSVMRSDTRVVWRCHVGIDHPNELALEAWSFLRPYVEPADAYVFSRRSYAWEGLDRSKIWLVAPSIDAFSAKNQEMAPETVASIMARTGLGPTAAGEPVFVRADGSEGTVERPAEVDQDAPAPGDVPLVVQVSRWDHLKDPSGVLRMFSDHLRNPVAHLLLVGPSVADVADDPEGAQVLAEVREQRAALPVELRGRVHLACAPMADVEENAAIINAVQRRADIVLQKSLAEGFGLTVAEAMWKAKPVVASRIGGIQDQIEDGVSGTLIDDPLDLRAAATAVDDLLEHPARAAALGAAARESVRDSFLGTRHLVQYLELLERMLARS
jgi:trehalose synthase